MVGPRPRSTCRRRRRRRQVLRCRSSRAAVLRPPPARSTSPASFTDRARLFHIGQHFVCGALTGHCAAFHETLEIDGRVLACEETVALADLLVAGDRLVLADLPV